MSLSPALYVVATPIGNLEDIGRRAARILRSVAVVAAEDTRSSQPLLRSIGAGARCIALHAHNEAAAAGDIVARILQGQAVALISDAGTPGISDPGARLVSAAHQAGVRVVPIPGASATTALVSASGLPDGRFLFEGFLPARPKQRRKRLAELDALACAFLVFEAPHRIEETAADLAATLEAQRELVVGRELTKQFEQVARIRIGDFTAWLAADPNRRRGEFALLVFAAARDAAGDAPREEVSGIGAHAMAVLSESMPPRQAARLAARISGDAADALYRRAVSDRAARRPEDGQAEDAQPEDELLEEERPDGGRPDGSRPDGGD